MNLGDDKVRAARNYGINNEGRFVESGPSARVI